MSSRRTARSGGSCPSERRAFHAGLSCWQGERDLNFVSIGVEIVNPGHEWGYRSFPGSRRWRRSKRLCRRHSLAPPDPGASGRRPFRHRARPQDRPRRALRLAAACPRRDRALAERPVSRATAAQVDRARALADLAAIGYCSGSGSEEPAVAAFQRRFRPGAGMDGSTATQRHASLKSGLLDDAAELTVVALVAARAAPV